MKHDIYFLISPNDKLVARLKEVNVVGLLDLSRPIMWTGAEHDKSNVSHEEFDDLAKILFLDVARREWGPELGFFDVFGEIEISTSYFDAHWMLQRVLLDMSMEIAIRDAIASATIDDVKCGRGNSVVGFIDDFYDPSVKKDYHK